MTKDYEKSIAEACEDMIGSVGGSLTLSLQYYLDRTPEQDDLDAAEKYMLESGIQECSCCGWYQCDNDGSDGCMCSNCAEDEESLDD